MSLHNLKISFAVAIVALIVLGGFVTPASAASVKNIVLVHGAWADGSGWKGVYNILLKNGYKISIVQEPLTSFQDDVAATKRVLAQQDGPCILVAHSYGGSVITQAGADPSVVGLVYIAAHILSLMHYWTGKITSGVVSCSIPWDAKPYLSY
jgi:pimeloyl-ACP methyl ester carboxylesterase